MFKGEQTAGDVNAEIVTTSSCTTILTLTLSLDFLMYLSEPNVLRLRISVFSDFNSNLRLSSSEMNDF